MVYHKLFFDRFQYLYQIPANFTYQICPNLLSLPVRERGLKFNLGKAYAHGVLVAPRAGAWIEIRVFLHPARLVTRVAPRAGAWIEMM